MAGNDLVRAFGDPLRIREYEILVGISAQDGVDVIEDRRAAIGHAVKDADARDVVLIAGKGHEDYQEVAGERLPFSDMAQAQSALLAREGGAA